MEQVELAETQQWMLFAADSFVTVNHQRKMTSYHVEAQSEFDHKTCGLFTERSHEQTWGFLN